MKYSTFRMILDLQETVSKYELRVKDMDMGTRKIEVTFADGGQPFDLSDDNFVVTLLAKLPSGTVTETACEVSENKASVVIPDDVYEAGEVECEFRIEQVHLTHQVELHSSTFRIIVTEAMIAS